jgi:hypothetical protein
MLQSNFYSAFSDVEVLLYEIVEYSLRPKLLVVLAFFI